MLLHRRACGLVALGFLAACAGGPEPLGSSENGIAFTIQDDRNALAEALRLADTHCGGFDRVAVLQSVGVASDDDNRIATFACSDSREDGVTIVVEDAPDSLAVAEGRASSFCAGFGRQAVLKSSGELDGQRVVTFDCTTT